MRGERQLLGIGEYLIGRACQRLPKDIREERHREWVAELPAVLHDPQVRLASWRAVRMLGYAADTLRGTAMTHARTRSWPPRMTVLLCLLLVAGLVAMAWNIWTTVRAPENALSYVQLTSSLLVVAFPISMLVHAAERVTVLIAVSGTLAGVVRSLWNVVQAPGDWVNYFTAAWLSLLLLALWLASRWARTRPGIMPRAQQR